MERTCYINELSTNDINKDVVLIGWVSKKRNLGSLVFIVIRDVSSYPNNNDLMLAADILISDYSGIFFEFGVQNKLMFCFAYDYLFFLLK